MAYAVLLQEYEAGMRANACWPPGDRPELVAFVLLGFRDKACVEMSGEVYRNAQNSRDKIYEIFAWI